MSRTYLITGAASGTGKATVALLRSQGHTVIGADLKDSDISTDLSTVEGRAELVTRTRELTGGRLDAVISCAGIAHFDPLTIKVNHFGAVATLDGLRPLLAAGTDPRALVIGSIDSVHPTDPAIVEAALADDEEAAVAASRAAVDRGEGPPSTPHPRPRSPAGSAAAPSPRTGPVRAFRSTPSAPA
jgi:NAD(P)-dependent dehydrogenase (short-subunit alcohol dehydrogenase family)